MLDFSRGAAYVDDQFVPIAEAKIFANKFIIMACLTTQI